MSKRDLERRIDRQSPVVSGEMVAVASVTQVQHLTISGPYSGDFQIVDNGRLIVGQDPDIGNRGIISPYGIFGYNNNGVNVFSVWFKPAQNGGWTSGDVHAGNLAANYMLYDQSEGTFGLYTPAGAGVLLDNDGSARFGHSDGGNMLWDSASESLKIRSGAVVVSEIDSLGNASFTGVMTATGGRITGDMQVDARLRAGDVDGPAVYVGKLVDEDGTAYAGQILVTDTENVPWFHVRTGSDGTGYLHVGRPGDYPNRLTLEVTPTAATLTFDGTAYLRSGSFTGEVSIGSAGSLTFGTDGEGTLDDTGVSLISNAAGVPGPHNSYKFTKGGRPLGGVYGYHDVGATNIFTQLTTNSAGIDGDWDAYTLIYALGGASKEARVTLAAQGNNDAYSISGIDMTSRTTGDASLTIGGGLDLGQIVKTSDFTLGYTGSAVHRIHYIINAAGGNVVGTLPALSAVQAGRVYVVSRSDGSGNTATIQRAGSDTIGGATSFTLTQYQTAMLFGYPTGAVWYKIGP